MFSCDNTDKVAEEEKTFQLQRAKILQKKINISPTKEVTLLKEANDSASNWAEYMNFQNEIRNIQNFTYQELASSSNNIRETSLAMKDSVPPVFNVNPVKVRLNVLYTKSSMLNQLIQRQVIDTTRIKTTTADLQDAFQNLKIQLNEVFLGTLEEFEKEIEKSIKPQDSTATNKV
ncbi:hypothetical protein DNG35_05200 [Mesonia sp. K7]|nr:hypothetical protein DNG35_05200 [Mesonia sp. K7]